MISTLAQPFVLARLVTAAAASLLLAAGVRTSARVLRHWRVGALSEGQIVLERRAELVATIMQATLAIVIVGFAGTLLAADHLSASIRGAMCAYGVFASTRSGFQALGTSAAAAAACGLWLVLHRLDLRLRAPTLTRRKFITLFAVAPLVWLDFAMTTRFALELDLGVVSSCCSTSLDSAAIVLGAAEPGRVRTLLTAAGAGAALLALASALLTYRRPGGARSWATVATSLVAAAAALPAIVFTVAPYAYETPRHLCPFCLLHADVWGLGWYLFGALFVASVLGVGVGVVEANHRACGEPEQAADLMRSLARAAALCWGAVLALGAAPIVRYLAVTGGLSLFGGS